MTEFIGDTLDVIGKLLVAYTALMVHHRVRKEHQIDEMVFKTMKAEQVVGILGVCLIIIGYIVRTYGRFFLR